MNEKELAALRKKRRRRVRWTVAILVIVAVAFYLSVIVDYVGG